MTPAEAREVVMQIVAGLAGVTPDSITDETNLESLGLDSSDAVVLAMEVEEKIGREVEVGLFLRCATVGEAAAEIGRMAAGAAAPDPREGIEPSPRPE
jgi:acyl carrier protein